SSEEIRKCLGRNRVVSDSAQCALFHEEHEASIAVLDLFELTRDANLSGGGHSSLESRNRGHPIRVDDQVLTSLELDLVESPTKHSVELAVGPQQSRIKVVAVGVV